MASIDRTAYPVYRRTPSLVDLERTTPLRRHPPPTIDHKRLAGNVRRKRR
jgi:hypothetical protein